LKSEEYFYSPKHDWRMTIAESRFLNSKSPVKMSSKGNRDLVPAAMTAPNDEGQLPNIDSNYSKVNN